MTAALDLNHDYGWYCKKCREYNFQGFYSLDLVCRRCYSWQCEPMAISLSKLKLEEAEPTRQVSEVSRQEGTFGQPIEKVQSESRTALVDALDAWRRIKYETPSKSLQSRRIYAIEKDGDSPNFHSATSIHTNGRPWVIPGHSVDNLSTKYPVSAAVADPPPVSPSGYYIALIRSCKVLPAWGGQILYAIQWDLCKYLKTEDDSLSLENIGKTVTLVGSSDHSRATTCKQFVSQMWPVTGSTVLRAFSALVAELQAVKFQRHSGKAATTRQDLTERNLTVELFQASKTATCYARVTGSRSDVVAVGEELIWIACAFRQVSHLAPVQGSTARISTRKSYGYEPCSVIVELEPLADAQDTLHSCWKTLFRGGTIVHKFSTSFDSPMGFQKVSKSGQTAFVGAEIPFQLMLHLAGVRYPLSIRGLVILRGNNIMLFPVEFEGDAIQWHLWETPLLDDISIDEFLSAHGHNLNPQRFEDKVWQNLPNMRHFVSLADLFPRLNLWRLGARRERLRCGYKPALSS